MSNQQELPYQGLSLEENIEATQHHIASASNEILRMKAQRQILKEQLEELEGRLLIFLEAGLRGGKTPMPQPQPRVQPQPQPEQVPDKQDFQGQHGRPRGMWGQVSFDGEKVKGEGGGG